jgi:hypothetical protein
LTTLQEASADQHLFEMRRNKEVWEKKPLLKAVYGDFYQLIRNQLSSAEGSTVELGSGIGAIKNYVPDCVTTDIFPNPWLDRRENAYALNFRDGCLSNLILLDVFHHLKFPGTALREFRRVLARGGRVIMIEPAMGFFGKIVYGLFHHEPLGLSDPIIWLAPAGFDPERAGYYAAQANASRVFLKGEFSDELRDWRLARVHAFADLAYVASGGFSKPQLYPSALLPLIRRVENLFLRWPELTATRLLVVLEKPLTKNQDGN